MDAGTVHYGINFGALAFWGAIAAIVIATSLFNARRETEKHETLRRIIEKTGQIDEARLKELFSPSPGPFAGLSCPRGKPGGGYRGLRVAGTLVMFIGAGLAAFFLIVAKAAAVRMDIALIGLASASVIAIVGVGLFFASRFAEPPPNKSSDQPPAH
jgi:hypothetical protein